MKMKGTLVMTAISLTVVLVMAQTASAGYFSDRQQHQKQRIRQGIASGQLTPREAQRLYQNQRKLHRIKQYALADGHVSRKEGRILLAYLERSSREIYRYKHNHRRAAPHPACRRGIDSAYAHARR